MPRRNHRSDYQPPEDLTPLAFIPNGQRDTAAWKQRIDDQVAAAERQRIARMQNGIDWSVCLVPGCGNELLWRGKAMIRPELRDPSHELQLCTEHSLVVWQYIQDLRGDPVVIETNQMMLDRFDARKATEAAEAKAAYMRRTDGDIYFVRVGHLVKVGWSRTLRRRLKEYGPSAEVLCHFPGTFDDEQNLHRQLRPALAKASEWYEDGDIIAMFIEKALAKYGPPTVKPKWTEHKPTVASRNYR